MTKGKVNNLIVKYLTNEANTQDLDELSEWILKKENEKYFDTYVRIHFKIRLAMNEPNIEVIKNNLIKKIKEDKYSFKIRRTPSLLKYAAVFLIGVFVSISFFNDNFFKDSSEGRDATKIVDTDIITPGTDAATLTLEDGSQIDLGIGKSIQTQNAIASGEKIVYKKNDNKEFELVFNYLTVPRGGQFFIELSDGTKVWLNSDSQLKYPANFINGQTREVELVYGEAYFDVSPSAEHEGSKFVVFNKSQEVEVLGTEFNIKAYKDETNIYTTLVEGKVSVSSASQTLNLMPSQQSNLDLNTNVTTVEKIDVYSEVSWKEGVFSFDGKSIQEIMTVLSRWYDINVVYEANISSDNEFVGIFRKNKTIKEILSNIKKSGIIKDFEINNHEVILK